MVSSGLRSLRGCRTQTSIFAGSHLNVESCISKDGCVHDTRMQTSQVPCRASAAQDAAAETAQMEFSRSTDGVANRRNSDARSLCG
jgi:hypothetical protein